MSSVFSESSEYSAFRTVEKYFKSRQPIASTSNGTPLLKKRFKRRGDPSLTYPSLREQGVLDLSRPTEEEQDEVRKAGWVVDEDVSGGRRVRKVKLKGSENDAYIVGDGTRLFAQCCAVLKNRDTIRSSPTPRLYPPFLTTRSPPFLPLRIHSPTKPSEPVNTLRPPYSRGGITVLAVCCGIGKGYTDYSFDESERGGGHSEGAR